jgi:GAF domain-containing protein
MIKPIVGQGKVLGIIQIANSEKQLQFTEEELNVLSLLASRVACFIIEMRDYQAKQAVFKK